MKTRDAQNRVPELWEVEHSKAVFRQSLSARNSPELGGELRALDGARPRSRGDVPCGRSGLDKFTLIDAFVDARMTRAVAKRFIANLRPDRRRRFSRPLRPAPRANNKENGRERSRAQEFGRRDPARFTAPVRDRNAH